MDENTYADGNPIYETITQLINEPFNDLIAICRTSQYLSCEVLEDEEREAPFLSVYMNDKDGNPVTDWALRFYEDGELWFEWSEHGTEEVALSWKRAEGQGLLGDLCIISVFRTETINNYFYDERESEIQWPEL